MSDSVWLHRRKPTRLPRPWDSPGKNTGVGCHFLLQCMKVKSEREVAQSCPTLCDPKDCSLPGSSSMGFSRQEYWSGVPLHPYKRPTYSNSFYPVYYMWFSKKKITRHTKRKKQWRNRVNIRNQTHIAEMMELLDWEFKQLFLITCYGPWWAE